MAEHTPGPPGPPPTRPVAAGRPRWPARRSWSALVPVVAALAGLLLTTTAHTAAGTNLRDDRRPALRNLILEREGQVATDTATAAALRAQIDRGTAAQAGSDGRVRQQTDRANAQRQAAGFTTLRGPGLTVSLNDAPRRPDGSLPPGAHVDDVVVHQQDVQAVVNALWAGGAEAMTIQGVRVISTSAVRCVGNTLLLHGRVYSPPFDIAAIGDRAAMQSALNADPGVRAFQQAAADFGLGYLVDNQATVTAPAFTGSVTLDYAQAVQ